MPNYTFHARRSTAVALVLLCGGALSACGESSKTTSNAAAASTVAGSTSSAPATAAGASTTSAPSSTKAAATARTAPAAGAPRRAGRAGRAVNAPFFNRALVAFVACVRRQGIPIPQANTKGPGPIFDVKGLDTKSPKFRAALSKCRPGLAAALLSRQRALHGGAGGAPAK
jgi:hypothetical protein